LSHNEYVWRLTVVLVEILIPKRCWKVVTTNQKKKKGDPQQRGSTPERFMVI
jgi:hypothetical protein